MSCRIFFTRRRAFHLGATALFATVIAMSFPSAASAGNEFGTRYYNVAQEYGGGVNLKTPSVGFWTVASNEFVLHRQVSQDEFSSTTGLIQDGLYRSGANLHLDNCALSVNAYRYYYEWKATGSSTFVCGLGPVATVGDEGRAATANTASDGTWAAYARSSDGATQAGLTVHLNWNFAYVMLGSELASTNSTFSSYVGAAYGTGSSVAAIRQQ